MNGLKAVETVSGYVPGWGMGVSIGAGFLRASISSYRGNRKAWKSFALNTAGTLTFYGKFRTVRKVAKFSSKRSRRAFKIYSNATSGTVGLAGNYGRGGTKKSKKKWRRR